ncbi:tetratricopeptide repeat protein [Mesonia aestuariivivens]|uniref:Tetratricopeptide repeat protein n=1 Tax=Mesonia aestuariivivens TaxID=2796128 RepID=A0ABS6W4S2_9FLAO|nr:tetratricopeptide repeat protein [Mesonia aestuariivivens]MBW2962866.1 tetratricopeptide repeat protein [Mesonia aestuariivivens]
MKSIKLNLRFLLILLVFGFGTYASLQAQTKSSDSLYVVAKKWGQQKGNYQKALEIIKKANQISPQDIDIQEYLGKCHLEVGQYDKARYILRKAADARLQNYTALTYLVNVESTTQRYSSAICYVNEMLEQTPYEKGLWIKKMNLYREMGNHEEAMRELKRIHQIFPEDKSVQENYIFMMSERGKNLKTYAEINDAYNNIIKEDPSNKDAYLALIKNEIENSGDTETAIIYSSKALKQFPNDIDLIQKKIGLLEETHRYQEAINLLEEKKENFNKKEYYQLKLYLKSQAAGYYDNVDPYVINKKIYAENPYNKQALNYILRNAIAKGYYTDAIYFLNKALEKDPNNKELLLKKLSVYKSIKDDNGYQKTLERLYNFYPEDVDIQYNYQLNKFEEGKDLIQQEQLYEAKSIFLLLKTIPEWEVLANEQLYNISMQQQKYEEALVYTNLLIEKQPDNPEYKIQKSDLYFKTGQYENALNITGELTQTYPESEKYHDIYESQLTLYISELIKNEAYREASSKLDNLLKNHKTKQLYLYSINTALITEDIEKATALAEEAHQTYPEDLDIALKLADVYLEDYKTDWTIAVLEPMLEDHPYNQELKSRLAIAYYKKGMYRKSMNRNSDAYRDFTNSIDVTPKNNKAVNELVEAYHKANEDLRALNYINKKIKEYPWLDNLKVAKGKIYENMKDFKSALEYQKIYRPSVEEASAWKKHIEYLTNRAYENQIDASYSRFDSDSTLFVNRLARFKYTRFTKKNAYAAGFNYVGRESGAGVQLDVEWQHTFSSTLYAKANYYLSNRYFPRHRFAVNVFKSFKYDWELELGARYDILQSDRDFIAGVVGISKPFNQFWLNAKLNYLTDSDDNYLNFALRSKYMIEHRNFVQLMVSAGTAPYDPRLSFQNDRYFDFVHTMVGAGYQYPLNKNLAFGFYGNWYNYKLKDDYFENQYELTLVCEIRF